MLKRIHVRGFKSLADVEVSLEPLTLLFGPNASGKSNLLDALQLLSRLATSRTLKDAFAAPCRGKPLESFSIGERGIKGLLEQERLTFSMEADLQISEAVVESVNRQISELNGDNGTHLAAVNERALRYRVEVEMLPRSGLIRVANEYLAALNDQGEPTATQEPFIALQADSRIHLRPEGEGHSSGYARWMDHTILSMPLYPPHYPHVVAARRELERWLFFYFEPRERMRAAIPVREVGRVGLMGDDLAGFLNTLKTRNPGQFEALEKALQLLLPDIDGIDVEVTDVGEIELGLTENGVKMPARVLSDGTLRMLGLLALANTEETPALVAVEEPENGIHARRIGLLAELLNTQKNLRQTQYIVTSHSPILPDLLPDDSLFVVRRLNGRTRVDPLLAWGPVTEQEGEPRQRTVSIQAFATDTEQDVLPISERILRGDFDA